MSAINIDVEDMEIIQVIRTFSKLLINLEKDYLINKEAIDDVVTHPDVDLPEVLDALIAYLDDMDSEDAFGTEGWKHRYGFDDH